MAKKICMTCERALDTTPISAAIGGRIESETAARGESTSAREAFVSGGGERP